MDDALSLLLLALLILGAGWFLGIAGFFKSRRALAEVVALRARLAAVERPSPEATVPGFAPPAASAEPAPAAPAPAAPEPAAPVPPPTPVPAAATLSPARPRPSLEELITLRWGVWLGGAALLLSGVFLIRYAVELGVVGPAARCGLAALLGLALIGLAEWLGRKGAPSSVRLGDQAPPSLAAAGVAVLLGAAYGVGVYYALVPPLVGFGLMALAGLAGLVLSLRYGQPVGAIGLIGAFITPALVETEDPSLPGLFAYLLVVTASALAIVRYTGWTWLGWGTTIAGSVWVMLATTMAPAADAWAPAFFVPAAALLHLALLPQEALALRVGRQLAWIPFAALGAAGLLVDLAFPGWPARLGLLLLAPIAIWKGTVEPRLDRLPWLASLLFLLVLLCWALPDWQPDSAVASAADALQVLLLGPWTPSAIRPFLLTAAAMAALFAAAGLWQERQAPRVLIWSALAAAMPTLTLAATYAQVEQLAPSPVWAIAAAVVAAAQMAAAAAAQRDGRAAGIARAGVHAAGAMASLALGCAMILSDQWLTVAVALFLLPLAWIEARADLPPLRKVALAVASVVIVRLLLNQYVLDYALGDSPVWNGLLVAYGLPAACFAIAASMFRRRGDDLTVGVLQAGSAALVSVLVVLEIRHWATGGHLAAAETSFLENALQVSALSVLSYAFMRIARRTGQRVLRSSALVQGALALLGGFALLAYNPAFVAEADVGSAAIFDALLPAYLLPALLAVAAQRDPALELTPRLRRLLAIYAFLALFAWMTLEIRHLFHRGPMGLSAVPVEDAELWSWSGAWLLYAALLMVAGARAAVRELRLAALAVIGLTTAKVFLIDMAGLNGLWRVLSFLGLGLTLIGVGVIYRRFLPETSAPDAAASPTTG